MKFFNKIAILLVLSTTALIIEAKVAFKNNTKYDVILNTPSGSYDLKAGQTSTAFGGFAKKIDVKYKTLGMKSTTVTPSSSDLNNPRTFIYGITPAAIGVNVNLMPR